MERLLSEMIEEYRSGNREVFVQIAEKMRPAIRNYAARLYRWEREDAQQELTLALLEGIRNIQYVHSEGECVRFCHTCIRHAYVRIVRKEKWEVRLEEEYTPAGASRDFSEDSVFYLDVEKILLSLKGRKRAIMENLILYGNNEKETAEIIGVSHQYVSKIKYEIMGDILINERNGKNNCFIRKNYKK